MSKDLNGYQNTLLGVTAAFIEGIILQPTLYWKNARALNLPFSLNPVVLYRGTVASIFNECQMMGLQFGFTGFYQKLLITDSDSKFEAKAQEFLSAALGGVSGAFFASPVELVMIQQQINGGTSVGTFMTILNRNKIFRGLLPTIARDSIYVTGMLGVTPVVQNYLVENQDFSVSAAGFYASLIGGVLAALPSHPFDIMKTCMQAKNLNAPKDEILSMRGTLKRLYNEGGVRRIYSGAAWRTFNITATVYVANECRVRMSPFFAKL
jgi:solute carrier family 25 (mitochondrial citrate transporter), member 1